MPVRKKTRVGIETLHSQAELFSVHERPSGDLIILIKRNNFHIVDEGFTVPLLEERLTVHVSPCSPGHTITRKVILENGNHRLDRNIVLYKDGAMRWPLFGKRPAFLDAPVFAMRNRPCDVVVDIGRFDPRYNNLIFVLIVKSKMTEMIMPWGGWNAGKIAFAQFDLVLMWAFAPITSLEQGDTVYPQLDEDRVESMDLWTLMAEIGRLDLSISGRLADRIETFDSSAGSARLREEQREKLLAMASIRHGFPFDDIQ